MKTKKYLLLAAIAIVLAGCSAYPHGKLFKPNHSQVSRCKTYDDVRR